MFTSQMGNLQTKIAHQYSDKNGSQGNGKQCAEVKAAPIITHNWSTTATSGN